MLQQSLYHALQNAVGLPLRAFLGVLQSNHPPLPPLLAVAHALSLPTSRTLPPPWVPGPALSPFALPPLGLLHRPRPRRPPPLDSGGASEHEAQLRICREAAPPPSTSSLPCCPATEIESGGGNPTSTRVTPMEEAGSVGGPPPLPEHDGDPRPPPPSPA
jgi:hypothetical protein